MNNIDLNTPTTNDHNYVFKENAGRNVSIENAGRNDNGRDDYLLKIDASEENAGQDAANADRIAYGWERLRDNNNCHKTCQGICQLFTS